MTKALVICDDPATCEQVVSLVSRCGFDLRNCEVVGMAQARGAAAATRRDLAILVDSEAQAESIALLRELSSAAATPIVFVGPAEDSKFILRTLREGAEAYVDVREMTEDLVGAIQGFNICHDLARQNGDVVGVLAAGGGSGASTIAANLAVATAQLRQRCALYDLHFAAGDQNLFFDLQTTRTIADLCRNRSRLDLSMFRQCFTDHASGVSVLPAPADPQEVTLVAEDDIRRAVDMGRMSFPGCILDLDPRLPQAQLPAVRESDIVLLVIRLDLISVGRARQAIDQLNVVGVGDDRIRLVVSQAGRANDLSMRHAEQALGLTVAGAVAFEPANAIRSLNKGVPLLLERPRSKAAKSLRKLAASIAATSQTSSASKGRSAGLTAASKIAAQFA